MKYAHVIEGLDTLQAACKKAQADLANPDNIQQAVKSLNEVYDMACWTSVETRRTAGIPEPTRTPLADDAARKLDEVNLQITEVLHLLKATQEIDDIPEHGLNMLSGIERLLKLLGQDYDALHSDLNQLGIRYMPQVRGVTP
jgi:hypothetical protein